MLEYEYEPEMEDSYRSGMLKTFKKTLDDGFFPFIIIDAINDKVKYFDQFWSAAKTKGFEVSCPFLYLKIRFVVNQRSYQEEEQENLITGQNSTMLANAN